MTMTAQQVGHKPATMSIDRLSPACGAVVRGVDLRKPLAPSTVQELHQALAENGILLFRDADITPAEHVAFSRHFGPLEAHVIGDFGLPGQPEIFVVSNIIEGNKPKGAVYAGQ